MNRSSDNNDVNAQVQAIWSATQAHTAAYIRRKAGATADHAHVDDAIAEATLRLHRTLSAGRPAPDDSGGWMKVVAWREYLRLFERRGRHYGGPLSEHLATAPDDPLAEVLEHLADDALARAFTDATGRLTGHQRAVLADWTAGRTYQETADRLGVSLLSVEKALRRARHTLHSDVHLTQAVQAWRA